MFSYIPILEKYLHQIDGSLFYEWGPGKSTHIILKNIKSDANLISVEHQEKYFEKIKSEIQDDRWKLFLESATKRASNYAFNIMLQPNQDLIFVDGRRRVECCFAAMQKIKSNGVIILHDSNRVQYLKILSPYIDIIENNKNTLVFRPKRDYSILDNL